MTGGAHLCGHPGAITPRAANSQSLATHGTRNRLIMGMTRGNVPREAHWLQLSAGLGGHVIRDRIGPGLDGFSEPADSALVTPPHRQEACLAEYSRFILLKSYAAAAQKRKEFGYHLFHGWGVVR